MKPTLIIMAAGMGSRFGGLKQITPVGPSGEKIIDYSIYDAIRAGFVKVVFVIKRAIEEEFKAKIGNTVAAHVPVGLHQQDGRAILHGLERSGQTRAARADDDDVGLIIPLDAGRILGDRCIRAEDARGGQTSRA